MPNKAQNLRKSKRFGCAVPVDGKSGSLFDNSQTVDVSKDGIGFISDKKIAIGEHIAIELALDPESEPVLVRAVVKWVRPVEDTGKYRIGLLFSETISGSRRTLNSQLKKELDDIDLADIENELDQVNA